VPKISVIIPVYKVEKYLRQCVDSVLAQTHSDLEVILVDDGSPDNCGAICDEYAEKDSRVKVIHKENGGQGSARNRGLDAATGEYIAFVDSDDWVDSDMYESLLKLLLEHDADIAEGSYRFFRPWKNQNQTLECPNTQKVCVWEGLQILERFYFGPDLFSDVAVMVWNKLYKAQILRDLRFREGFIYEDSEFMPRVLYACKKLVKHDHSYYTYNIHLSVGETSHSEKNYFKINSSVISAGLVAEFFADKGNEKIKHYTCRRYWNTLLEAYYNCRLLRKDPKCRSYAKELRDLVRKEKGTILKSPKFTERWQFQLFYLSPGLFCGLKRSMRGMKKFKYSVRKRLTGKN
jgi:glycosyltransferase involved in cell wall biosynthesis